MDTHSSILKIPGVFHSGSFVIPPHSSSDRKENDDFWGFPRFWCQNGFIFIRINDIIYVYDKHGHCIQNLPESSIIPARPRDSRGLLVMFGSMVMIISDDMYAKI